MRRSLLSSVLLFRVFFAQFFASESVTSDIQLRSVIIWILAFLVTPGFMISLQLVTRYIFAAIRGPSAVEPLTATLGFMFIIYSALAAGLVAVFLWDGLMFSRRDAMVLGPLPVHGVALIVAKVCALGALLLATTTCANLFGTLLFPFVASSAKGLVGVAQHMVAHATATVAAGVFVFCVVVIVRGLVLFVPGAGLSAVLGATLQLAFLGGVFASVLVIPAAISAADPAAQVMGDGWLPTAWYLGLYESMRGHHTVGVDVMAGRALAATASAVALAILVSVAGFWRQMQLALGPDSNLGLRRLGRIRWFAHRIVGHESTAHAALDFFLLTLSRNRALHTIITMNAALAIPVVAAAIWRSGIDPAALARPRTIILWIPLVIAFWLVIGFRAAFFVPSELPAAWTFEANAPRTSYTYGDASRAAMLSLVLPPILAISLAITGMLLGWRFAVWHTVYVAAVCGLLIEIVLLTITHVPFTQAYEPGHAKLKSHWPLYLFAMYACAYWPVQLELRLLRHPSRMVAAIGFFVGLTIGLGIWRRRHHHWSLRPGELDEAEPTEASSIFTRSSRIVQSWPQR